MAPGVTKSTLIPSNFSSSLSNQDKPESKLAVHQVVVLTLLMRVFQ